MQVYPPILRKDRIPTVLYLLLHFGSADSRSLGTWDQHALLAIPHLAVIFSSIPITKAEDISHAHTMNNSSPHRNQIDTDTMTTEHHSLPYRVENAIEDVKRILDETRSPKFFGDVDHSYEDKYALAEYVVNVGLASQLNGLEISLGLDAKKLKQLMELSQQGKRSVTLRFVSQETCSFLREEEVDLNRGAKIKTKILKGGVLHKSSETKVVATAMDYHWKLDTKYKFIAFIGSDPAEASVALKSGEFGGEVVQRGVKKAPRPDKSEIAPIDVGITHMLQLLKFSASDGGDGDSSFKCKFVIDREAKTCRTPLNNQDVEDVRQKVIENMRAWSAAVSGFFLIYARSLPHRLETNPTSPGERLDQEVLDTNSQIFIPVLPFFDSNSKSDEETVRDDNDGLKKQGGDGLVHLSGESPCFKAPVLTANDTASLLREHRRSLLGVKTSLKDKGTPIETLSGAEVFLCAAMKHFETLCEYIWEGVFSIEEALRNQLIAAVGKHIEAKDFAEYMRFHNRRLLRPEYAPTPFCFSVRRPDHYPEGTLSILSNNNSEGSNSDSDSVFDTLSRKIEMNEADRMQMPLMSLPINAATNVQVGGDRYVHAILAHEFDNHRMRQYASPNSSPTQLVARARQFSCFMLVLGTVTGPNTFDPSSAIILQNKDELIIPLLLEQMPSPKEFKDDIQSLSPEQKRFAKAFRNMQLSSSVFGVVIIQLKPQLEKLLKLPTDALTKEVKLTQSLLELFMEYQIPSDLLTYDHTDDSSNNESAADKVNVVRGYVKGVEDMISDAKKKTIADEESKAEMRHAMHFPATSTISASLDWPPEYQATSRCAPPRSRTLGRAALRSRPQAMMNSCSGVAPPDATASVEMLMPCSDEAAVFGSERPLSASRNERQPEITESKAETLGMSDPKLIVQEPSDSDKQSSRSTTMLDFSSLPKTLDERFEQFDEDSALRPTKVKPGPVWTKKFQRNILSKEESRSLNAEQQQQEKNKAFDLLDALSRSGSLPIHCAELHVMVAATHCFDKSLIDTVIHDNINPIEKFERSVLIVTSVLHGDDKKPMDLIATPQEAQRIMALSPKLLTTSYSSTES
jgi:hypothetical protein